MGTKGIIAIISIVVAVIAAIVLGVLLYSTSDKLKQTEAALSTTKTTLQATETAKTGLEKKLTETPNTPLSLIHISEPTRPY